MITGGVDLKLLNRYVAILLALFVVAPALYAGYPLPGSDKQAPVLCTNCLGTNFGGQLNKGLPTYPFSAPIVKHVGRLVDSSATKDVQNIGIRTIRAGKVRVQPGTSPSRVYVKMGGAIGAYSLNTFFTSTLPAGMKSVSSVANVSNSRTKYNSPNEELTVWDAHVYAEGYGSSWPVTPDDKQDVLHDFDADDRGYVYAAYSVFGWGILQDNNDTGGGLLGVVSQTASSASVITVVKVGTSYYAAVGENSGPSLSSHSMFNVTNAGAPVSMGTRSFGLMQWAKNDAHSRIAIIDHEKKLRIYDYQTFAQGGLPLHGPISAPGGFSSVTIDESGHVWALTALETFDATVRRFTPVGSTQYTMATLQIGEQMQGRHITSGGGYIAVAGGGLAGGDVILFKVEGTNIRRLDLKNFFNKYYHHAPVGYANPPTDFSYVAQAYGLQLIKRGNKLYIVYNAHGMGDVYEIEAGDSIGAQMRTTNFGTNNPNAKGTESGPFPGDVVKFVASSSSSSVSYQVSWDFDNPQSGRNLAQTATGSDASHQFVGYTTASEVTTPKKVTATVTTDGSLTDTVTVNLKVPAARIGVAGSATAITGQGTPLTLLLGDHFTDASDGSVESHVANWVIDAATPTKLLPTQAIFAGNIGQHSVSLVSAYGRYDGQLNLETAAYTTSVSNIAYTVRPFLFTVNAAKSGADAVFSGTARVTSNTQVLTATQWTVTWTLKNGPTVVQTQSATVPIGQIPNFVVPMTSVPTGSVATLEASVPPSSLSAPAEYASYTQSMNLSKPDPGISKSGCGNVGQPCTLTAASLTGGSVDGWTFNWTLRRDGALIANATGNPYKPNLTEPGSYTIDLTAVKGIFEGTAQSSFNAAGALCGPPPRIEDQIAISSSCPNEGCIPGATITFRTSLIGYARQDCDTFTWRFGDNTSTTKVGTTVTYVYSTAASYTATLTVSNNSGHPAVQLSTTVNISSGGGGPVDPPPGGNCTRATGITISYSGNKGCGPGTPCKVGERVNFTGSKSNGNEFLSTSCDTAAWDFGDGSSASGRTTNHTYTVTGSRTVTLRVTTSGSAPSTPATVTIPIVEDGASGCTGAALADNLIPEFRGEDSRCANTNGTLCRRAETIQFDVKTFGGYTFQSCDQFLWTFGDATTSTQRSPTHAFTGTSPVYNVTLRVSNSNNPSGVTVDLTVPFDNTPVLTAPRLTINATPTGAKGVAVTFTATSDIPATNWSWNFGDGSRVDTSQAGRVDTTSTITHVFSKVGPFSVAVTAKNAEDATDRSTGTGLFDINISETPVHRFLLPAVIHAGGQNGSAWRTDVQVYHSAPNPAAEPLVMVAEFNGASTDLLINQSTFIYEDFMRKLVPNADAQGPVIITTQSKYLPQIWTRTYNVDASGRTYGQFIPAVSLDGTTGSSIDGSADPVKYYLAGLRENSRYRTNLGFINPNPIQTVANVIVYDDLRIPLTQFAVTMEPFQLVPINGLGTKVPNMPNRPVTLEITVPAGRWLVAYASFIDGFSNDPAYIPAIPEAELTSSAYSNGITPGVGHIGDWRSDVTIFNPDSSAVKLNLTYYDQSGLPRAEAKDVVVGSGEVKTYDDLLKVSGLWSAAPPDGLGMLRVTTTTPVSRYPLTFSRTYNDKGTGGTFGQGIPGFAAADANVKPGKAAIIPGVRSDANYKTNIGLTNTTAEPLNAVVRLLDPTTGAVAREISVSLAGYQSVVGAYDFGGLATGTLKIEITSGNGGVWAFASIINQGNDPEYVPAITLP